MISHTMYLGMQKSIVYAMQQTELKAPKVFSGKNFSMLPKVIPSFRVMMGCTGYIEIAMATYGTKRTAKSVNASLE